MERLSVLTGDFTVRQTTVTLTRHGGHPASKGCGLGRPTADQRPPGWTQRGEAQVKNSERTAFASERLTAVSQITDLPPLGLFPRAARPPDIGAPPLTNPPALFLLFLSVPVLTGKWSGIHV